MNTKTFAQQARKILLRGVQDKLRFWGFDGPGQPHDEPKPLAGGYLFRDQPYDDPAVPALWKSLRRAVQQKGIEVVTEEAAYTWFNRLVSIRILAKNGYEPVQLAFADGGGRTPLILQRAQRGTYPFLSVPEKVRLQKILADPAREAEAFAILLLSYCQDHTLLRTVFGSVDDYTELLLPDDILAEEGFLNLLNTTDAISDEDYRQVELIGWLYQFYISEKKDEVFASFKKKQKAEAKDIPAATQIFTPNWIVKYMVQNTVGKIWLDLHPDSPLRSEMKYLVEAPPAQPEPSDYLKEELPTTPLIQEVAQLKLLDPAVGSGHILVEGFDLLYEMYLAEYYPPEEAVESILKYNLFGLDIDKRAAQLAQFAVLLKAATHWREVMNTGLRPQIYAMPEPRPFSRQEVLDFLGREGAAYADALSATLKLMQQAQNLGSIMQFELPAEAVDYIARRWAHFQAAPSLSFHEQALMPALRAYLPVLLLLCQKYEAVVANPPYMSSGRMNEVLKNYLKKTYGSHSCSGKSFDLFAPFLELGIKQLCSDGLIANINQQTWMFIGSYKNLRKHVLNLSQIESMIHLGPDAFDEIGGEVVQTTCFVLKKSVIKNNGGSYFALGEFSPSLQKMNAFLKKKNSYHSVKNEVFLNIPDFPLAFWASEEMTKFFQEKELLRDVSIVREGIHTGKNDLFIRHWFEIPFDKFSNEESSYDSIKKNNAKWIPYNKGGGFRKWYGNNEYVLRFDEASRNEMSLLSGHVRPSEYLYFKKGLTWSKISSDTLSVRYSPNGFLFSDAGMMIFSEGNELYILALLASVVASEFIGIKNPTLNFLSSDLASIPVIISENPTIELKSDINVSISRTDWDSRETSWDFHASPLLNDQSSLRQAYAVWAERAAEDFFQLHANEEELNRIFIGIYGLEEELSPVVALKDVTILQEELDGKYLKALEPQYRAQGPAGVALPIKRQVVMQQLVSYLIGLCMGRYRLDRPGLHIAHPNPTPEELALYRYRGQGVEMDDDGILPLMGSACEFPDDALQRVKHLLDVIWGTDTRTDNLNFLQECLDEDLEKYLVKQFWKDHCRRYKKKPIYWLFSSEKGAFQALVYMHRMTPFTAERIRDKYLLPHIQYLRGKTQALEARAALLSTLEARQLDRLRKDLAECEAYELQLKTVADRQIELDLDDGAKRNYELFEGVVQAIK